LLFLKKENIGIPHVRLGVFTSVSEKGRIMKR
jgi:hypothetical protein